MPTRPGGPDWRDHRRYGRTGTHGVAHPVSHPETQRPAGQVGGSRSGISGGRAGAGLFRNHLRYLASVAAVPPGSGEAITIEARKVVTFKPGSVLKNAINGEAA